MAGEPILLPRKLRLGAGKVGRVRQGLQTGCAPSLVGIHSMQVGHKVLLKSWVFTTAFNLFCACPGGMWGSSRGAPL